MITDLNQIDTTTEEGKLLMAALATITTTTARDKTPYEVINELYELTKKMSF